MARSGELTRAELFLVAVAFALGLAYVWGLEEPPPSDVAEYKTLAVNLIHGKGYYLEPGYRAYRVPGLVLYLAAIYRVFGDHNDSAVRLVQVALFALCTLAYYRLACRLLHPVTAFLIAGAFAASHELIFWMGKPATEFLYTVLLFAACYLFVTACETHRVASLAGAFFFLGWAALTRPIAFAIFPLWLVLVASIRPLRRVVAIAAAATAFLLVVTPWLVRNAIVLGRPVIATSSGITLWWANHPEATVGGWYGVVHPNPGPVVWFRQGMTELEINDHLTREAIGYITSDWGRFFRLAVGRIGFMLLGYEVRLTNVPFDPLVFFNRFRVRLILWNAIWLMLAVVGAVVVVRRGDRRWWPLLALLLGSFAVHFVFTAVPRMRVPLLPVLFLLAAAGGEWLVGRFTRPRASAS